MTLLWINYPRNDLELPMLHCDQDPGRGPDERRPAHPARRYRADLRVRGGEPRGDESQG